MLSKQEVELLKSKVELAMEVLLRAADERVSWKQTEDTLSSEGPVYTFLPGVYSSTAPLANLLAAQPQEAEHEPGSTPAPLKAAPSRMSIQPSTQSLAPIGPSTEPPAEGDGSKTQIVLHGDNTFEYVWSMRRSGVRAMEFTVEMEGVWNKPVLNRTRRGDEDQRVFLSAKRIRFQRLSNFGTL